ncbi:MAG: hypothetical protein EHM47_00935 [Ignavibacteriales bacterium]|nr:MAG: hypothetical protein EHM47_00935 [Ignavibacteriales bacterium]
MMNKNKNGEVVLRDLIMIIIIFSGIIALASIFVNDMSDTYGNTNMSASYNQDSIGENQLNETASKWEEIGSNLNGNLLEMLLGTLQAAKEILTAVIEAPATFSNMLMIILSDIGVSESITNVLGFIITATLYIIIIFVIISARLQGGRV